MSDFNFDHLVEQHEMGRAYKAITAQMGPSPQLLAFVNYKNVTEDNVGLESFDIMTQHLQTLAEIDNNDNLDVALEGFVDTIKKYRAYLIGGGVAALLTGIATPVGLIALAAGVVGVVKNAKDVPTVKSFTAYTKTYMIIDNHLRKMSAQIPSDLDEAKWEKFYDALVTSDTEMTEQSDAAEKNAGHTNEPFDKSGWSESSFKNAVKWLHDEAEKLDQLSKSHATKFEAIGTKLTANKDGLGKTPSLVSKSFNFLKQADTDASNALHEVEAILKKVSKNFEIKGKE